MRIRIFRKMRQFFVRRKQRRLIELFGSLEWDTDYDYKAERSRDSGHDKVASKLAPTR